MKMSHMVADLFMNIRKYKRNIVKFHSYKISFIPFVPFSISSIVESRTPRNVGCC